MAQTTLPKETITRPGAERTAALSRDKRYQSIARSLASPEVDALRWACSLEHPTIPPAGISVPALIAMHHIHVGQFESALLVEPYLDRSAPDFMDRVHTMWRGLNVENAREYFWAPTPWGFVVLALRDAVKPAGEG